MKIVCKEDDLPGDSGSDGLLNVLTDPPMVLLLKITDRNQPGATAHCKFITCKKQQINYTLHTGSILAKIHAFVKKIRNSIQNRKITKFDTHRIWEYNVITDHAVNNFTKNNQMQTLYCIKNCKNYNPFCSSQSLQQVMFNLSINT